MSIEFASAIGTATVATAAAAILTQFMRPLLFEMRDRREKIRAKLKEQIRKKIEGGIKLEPGEVIDVGRGVHLSPSQSIDVLYQLYSEAEVKDHHLLYKSLLAEINRTEPFEALPEEARPSLARLSSLCSESSQPSDKELLHPITKLLTEYQEMKRDHATIKRQGRISYVVALISFFIGVVGLYLSFSGPSKGYIKEELEKATSQIENSIRTSQPNALKQVPSTTSSGRP